MPGPPRPAPDDPGPASGPDHGPGHRRSDPGPPARRRVRGDGVDLSVAEWGTPGPGPTTVLVHGYPDSSTVWHPVVAALRAGDPARHVVAPDVRGAGRSDHPRPVRAYRLPRLVADLVAVLEATSPGRPAHLVGHDWGSVQSWAAVADPQAATRIASFTSLSGPPLELAGAWARARLRPHPADLRALARQAARSSYVGALLVPGLGPAAWRLGLGRAWPRLQRQREGVATDADWPGPGLVDDAVAGVGLYRANLGPGAPRTPGAPARVPVQVLVLEDDAFLTPSLFEGIGTLSPGARLRRVEGGHWAIRRHPDRVASWIDDHIAASSGPGTGR
ncbi:MAG TPA: alpha/beta fold hydrolase [Acidimicrobiales bacterium]|nr:alpha/beta fold hydrolase [Acidimicrobiales bacterium]